MAAEAATKVIPVSQAAEAVAEQAFYIPMTGPAARPRRSLKHDDTFIVLDSHGDIGASAGGPDGLFNHDTRYLARLELVLDDLQPLLLGSNLRDDNSGLTVDLTNPDIYRQGRIVLQKDLLHIVRTIFLWRGTAYQRIGLQNHGEQRASFELTLLFDNDFADLFEVRGERRPHRGTGTSKLLGPTDVLFGYRGLDDVERTTGLHFDPRPTRLSVNAATWQLELDPHESKSLFVAVSCNRPVTEKPARFFRGLLAHRREMRQSTNGAASIETSNNIFNEVLCQAMADLNMLMTETPQGRYPYAGIPWYSTTFGRDGLITALQMLWVDPRVAKGVLRRLAHFQAKAVDPLADAAPGKILHEMRGGEMAALREVPFSQYYGSVDSTALFVLLAGRYVERTGDEKTLVELWPAIEAGLAWIDGPGDPDQDGFVEYQRATEKGLANQGWKDSSTRSSMPTASSRRATSRSPRSRAMSTPQNSSPRDARCGSASLTSPSGSRRRPGRSPSVLRRRSGARSSELTRLRSTAKAAMRGAHLECRAGAVQRHGPRGSRASGCRRSDGTALLLGLGHPHRRARRGALQSDVLSRRIDLAARQRADRARAWRTTGSSIRSRMSSRACLTPRPTWICAGCRNCSAASAARSGAARRSIRWPAHRRPGPARRRSRCWRPRSASSSTSHAARSACAIRICRRF